MKLISVRTIINPISLQDLAEILEMYQEPDSFKYIAPHKDKSIAYYQNFLNGKIEANKLQNGFWVVRDNNSNEFIGTVNLNQFMQTDMFHVGCHLRTKFWNQGYAKELCEVLIEYGAKVMMLSEIHGVVEDGNIVSTKLMKSLGFELKEAKVIDECLLNIYHFNYNSIK